MHHHQVLKAGNLQPVAGTPYNDGPGVNGWRLCLFYGSASPLVLLSGYCEFLQNYHQMPERLGWVGDHQYTYFDMKVG